MNAINRRAGVIAGLVSIIALMSKQARAEESQTASTLQKNTFTLPRGAVTFAVDFYTHYTFTFGGETVTLTPQEVWAALRSKEVRP